MLREITLGAVMLLTSCDRLTERSEGEKRAPSEAASTQIHALGEDVSSAAFVARVIAVEDPASVAGATAAEGSRHVAIDTLIRNASSDENLEHFKGQWHLYDREGHSYTYKALGEVREPQMGDGFIIAGARVRGWVTFEIPTEATLARVQFLPKGLLSEPTDVRSVGL